MPNPLQVGDQVPDFRAVGVVGQDERVYSTEDFLGKRNLIMFFYVYDWTPI